MAEWLIADNAVSCFSFDIYQEWSSVPESLIAEMSGNWIEQGINVIA